MLFEVYADGAARGQGTDGAGRGEAAIGIAIYKNAKIYDQFYRGLGQRTNAEAEYEAVLHGILLCYCMGLTDPIIYSDSQMVVNQVNGQWKLNTPALLSLWMSIDEMRSRYRCRLVHAGRRVTWEADALANLFLDKLGQKRQSLELWLPTTHRTKLLPPP